MRILNFGSLNIDKVYSVDHFVRAGETILCTDMNIFCGGKGLNQSVALARAGAEVYHAGAIGTDGEMLREQLAASGAHLDYLQTLDMPSGHTALQVTPDGQNCIIVCAGSNARLTEDYIDSVLAHFGAGDMMLVQNEVSNVPYIIRQAKARGLKIAFNASPITASILSYPLELVDYYLVNETEGRTLSGCDATDYETILATLHEKFPAAAIVLTVGSDGVLYQCGDERYAHGIYRVQAVDTTGAGDTFCGFFLASLAKGLSVPQALENSSLASALAVSRAGACDSIPTWAEMEAFAKTAQAK